VSAGAAGAGAGAGGAGAAVVLRVALDARRVEVELTIAAGETLALIGPNGAGKSTVVELVAGLLRPDRGDIILGGRHVVRDGAVLVPVHRRRIGMVGQDPALFPHRSVQDNVAYGPRATGASRHAARTRATEALATVGAGELADRSPASLSGGQAQRIAVARALATEPQLLLLDEPTSALDVTAQAEVRRVLADAVTGRAALLVTHDPLEVMTLADRVAVLEGGRVVEIGPVAQVLRRPTSRFGAAFSGLALLHGVATPTGLRLADGAEVHASVVDAAPGAPAIAAYHPTVARLVPGADARGSADAAPGAGMLVRRVDRLEPRDGLVRVVAEDVILDATIATLTAAAVTPGATVTVDLPASEVVVFPAP